MPVPGSNLLAQALTIISGNTVAYYKYLTREPNDIGVYVTEYEEPYAIRGSVQAVPRSLYQVNGLDFQKNYLTLYTSTLLLDIERDVSSDRFVWNEKTYQVLSLNNWHAMDGWVGVLAVEVLEVVPDDYLFFGFENTHFGFDQSGFVGDDSPYAG